MGEMPEDFLLYRACQRWRSLPNEGGMLDQEFELMMRFEGFARGEERRKKAESFYQKPREMKATAAGPVPGWAKKLGG
jgi:hypothetical protein